MPRAKGLIHGATSAFTRREFVAGSLAAGFAAAVRPVAGETVIATDSAGLVTGEVRIPVAGTELPAFRAMPDSGRGFPVVLVVQEIFGVHEHIKDVCRRLAKARLPGDRAGAVRAPGRRLEDDRRPGDHRRRWSRTCRTRRSWPISTPPSPGRRRAARGDTAKLGITGFCWGGRIVWLYAAHNPALRAGVAWYGRLVGPPTRCSRSNPIDLVRR